MITEETIARMKQNLEVKNEFFVLDVVKHLEKENEDLKNKNFVATQLYNNALTENKGLKDIITELRKENKQLQTRFHIVPEHYLTEALDKCNELERKNAEQNEIIHELHKPPLYDGYSLQLKNEELKKQVDQLSTDNHVLKTAFIEQQEQIEKIKVCGSCKYVTQLAHEEPCIHCSNCFACKDKKENKWELAE